MTQALVVSEEEIDLKIQEVLDNLKLAGECLLAAAKVYLELLEIDPNIKKKFIAAKLSSRVLSALEKIGVGLLLPELFFTHFQNMNLGIADQKMIIAGGVDYAIAKPDGTFDHKKVDLLNSSRAVVSQIIKDGKILTLQQQINKIISENNIINIQKTLEANPWKVKGAKLEIYKPLTLNKRELTNILNQMK